jgi:hypothetical protein
VYTRNGSTNTKQTMILALEVNKTLGSDTVLTPKEWQGLSQK